MATPNNYTEFTLTNKFADGATRKLTFGPYRINDSTIRNLKENVVDFNTDGYEEISDTYLSDTGAKFLGIDAAEVVVKRRTDIDLS